MSKLSFFFTLKNWKLAKKENFDFLNLRFTDLHYFFTQPDQTLFLFKSIWLAPPGVPGVSKELEGHKDQYLDVFLC